MNRHSVSEQACYNNPSRPVSGGTRDRLPREEVQINTAKLESMVNIHSLCFMLTALGNVKYTGRGHFVCHLCDRLV